MVFCFVSVVEYYCGNKPADVAFILDSSNSIWGPDFEKQITFVKEVVGMFQIGADKTRVGVTTYSHDVFTEIRLNEHFDKESLQDAVSRVRKRRGFRTRTGLALTHMRKRLFTEEYGARDGVVKVGIVMTDGRSRFIMRTMWEASKARRAGIQLFAIGIGSAVNRRELRGISSRPTNEYTFQVDSFAALESIKNILAIKTCIGNDHIF